MFYGVRIVVEIDADAINFKKLNALFLLQYELYNNKTNQYKYQNSLASECLACSSKDLESKK